MPVLQFELSDTEYSQLDEFARAANQRADEYAAAHVRQWLAGHKERVSSVWKTVLDENEELYRRLA